MGRLFGTDGIRGRANQYPMNAETALLVGRAAAMVLGAAAGAGAGAALIGQDTRLSGDMLAQAVAAGILSAGMPAVRVGVLPTPAVAYLAAATHAPLGIVVSASHNPFEDNGIKIFDTRGLKIDDLQQSLIEERIFAKQERRPDRESQPAPMSAPERAPREAYRDFLVTAGGKFGRLDGLHVVLDCANGAASGLAAPVFSALGAQVTTLADNPDGRNINAACGSEHPAALCRAVVASGARAGLAFDGDADRVVAVDESGAVLSGDQVIAILAQDQDRRQRLRPRCVVTTVMSNLGLGLALRRMGIALHTSDVGDRRVVEVMGRTGAVLGGEDSGHIILRDVHTTGDGMLAGLRLMSVLAGGGAPLSSLARVMTRYPQVLRSVPVKTKPPIESLEAVTAQIQAAQQTLQEQGRVLVRYSGTQALCRVMVEGPSREAIEVMCSRIADALRGAIG